MNRPAPRINSANRSQLIFDVIDYETLIPQDHKARIICRFVENLDLEIFYDDIKSRDGLAGRGAFDPKVLLSLWLYATVEGIGSARLLEKLCQRDCAYRWICGGLTINYHTLSDFRSENGDKLDKLLTDIITSLVASKIIKLNTIIIDGTKIQANASRGSFKRREKLTDLSNSVAERVKKLRDELKQNPNAGNDRIELRKQQELFKMERKLKKALKELPKIEAIKEARKKKQKKDAKISEPRVSITDPEARIMRFQKKTIAPAYNCQIAVDPETFVVVSVEVTNQGNDKNMLEPMIENIESRYNARPTEVLVDSAYRDHATIQKFAVHNSPTKVFSPLPKKKENILQKSLLKRKRKEAAYSEPVKEFYSRMETEAGKEAYKRRGRIETVNGIFHNRMLAGFRLRGIDKVKSEILMQCICHNIMQKHRIDAAA